MKVTAFLILAFCFQASATTLAQTVTLDEHKAPLDKVINDIKQQTGYSFFYNQDWLQQALPVDVKVKNAPLETALATCFANQPFDYAVVNKTIVLKPKAKPVKKLINEVVSPVSISGKITDSLGKQLIGATVAIKGRGEATITNQKGEFSIQAKIGDKIVISYIGFRSVAFTIEGNMPYLAIKLAPELNNLKEVVVNTGYESLPLERATGSFVQLDSALVNRRVSTDVLSRLEGIVPGLLFNRNTVNSSTGALDINIRGNNTLYSNDQPLVVLDNFPYDGDINNINPNDVASITVLKDAAAASIWGVRSGNGVIVITTKKGRVGQPLAVEFNGNLTVGNKPDLHYNPNFLDANDFINVEQTLFNTGYYDTKLNPSLAQPVSPVVQLLADARSGTISTTDANNQINAFRNLDVRNDISKYFYRESADQQYDLNLRGGGNKSDYYLSLGYDNNLANLVGNTNSRISINSNYNFYPVKNLQFTAGVFYTKLQGQSNTTLSDLSRISGINNIYPYARLADANGNALPIIHQYSQSFVNSPANASYLDWNYRPLDELHNADNKTDGFDNRLNLGLNYSFLKGFSLDLKYVYEHTETNVNDYFDQNAYYTRNLINEYTQKNADGSLSYPIPLGGILQQSNAYLNSQHIRGQLNYNMDWGQKNSLKALIGSEWSSAVNTADYQAPAYGYNNDTRTNYGNIDYSTYFGLNPRALGSQEIPNGQSYAETTDHFISYFSNIGYTYDGKYTVSLSGRIDHSNLFGVNTNQKAVPLYSAGLAWEISKAGFYHIEWLPFAKLRATYGYNGNINKSAAAVTTLRQQLYDYYTGQPYDIISNPGNPDLRWEKDRMINFGLDFSAKNQVLSGSIEYYLKNNTDLFGSSPLPPTSGYQSFYGNTASTAGHGADVTISSRNIYTPKFKWLTTFMYSHVIDKVTRYDIPSTVSEYIASGVFSGGQILNPVVGAPLYAIYSFRSGPLTHDSGDPQGYLNGKLSTDYTAIVENTDVGQLVFNGSARPTSFGSLRNTFTYKDWSLSFNIIYKLGYYFRKSSIDYSGLYADWIGNTDFAKRWQKPGDELKTTVPSMQLPPVTDDRDYFYGFSQTLVDNGDHIRLEDITINYDLTRSLWKNSPFTHLSVYGYINNVGILWRANHDGLDPDVFSDAGGGTTNLPNPRTYSIGIKSNFK